MRPSTIKRLTGVACGALTMAASSSALALDKYLDLEPAQTLTGPGYGYNSISREFVLRQCVSFGTQRITDGSGGVSGSSARFSSVTTNSQLADEMGIAVGTKFSASMGVFSVSASNKVSFFQGTKTNLLTQTILASYTNLEQFSYIAGDINLKPQYLAMVGTPAFRQNCGDYVLIGEQQGRWFYGTVQLTVNDTETQSKLAQAGAVDATYGAYSASVDENTLNTMKKASSTKDLKVNISSSGGNTVSITIDEFLTQVRAFPNASGPKLTYMLKAVPYESIVTNWPPSNPLAPLTAEQKLNSIAEAAAGFVALIADADFVSNHAALFALGTTQTKRDARLAYVRGRRTYYQTQLDDMRNSARTCDVDWNGSASCEALYQKWKGFNEFAIAEYSQFPVRYVSDCSSARTIPDLSGTLTTWLQDVAKPGSFTNTKGDTEMGGGPIRFTAVLDFKPNFSGGDLLATRGLLADLQVTMEETKGDHSTFAWHQNKEVLDLSKPDLGSGGAMAVTLNQCAYKGTGVRSTQVSPDSSFCDVVYKYAGQSAIDACKAQVAAVKHHGMIDWTTPKDARTVNFINGVRGVFTSLKCTVDGATDQDGTLIGCDDIRLLAVQLDMINRADVAADSWFVPRDPSAIQVPAGLRQMLGTMRAVRPRVKFQPRSCPAGLVNVGPSCVPALKR